MTENDVQEIEMQTYSINYSYPATYPNQLPYQWDGECHLTLNQAFNKPPDDNSLQNFSDESFLEENKDEVDEVPDNFSCSLCPMDFEDLEDQIDLNPHRKSSFISIGTLSTEGTNANQKGEKTDKLDEQLDFILNTIKKQKKPEPKPQPIEKKKKKRTRKRKTLEQLKLLHKETSGYEVLDRAKIKSLADRKSVV